jgi:hypothetical protein
MLGERRRDAEQRHAGDRVDQAFFGEFLMARI